MPDWLQAFVSINPISHLVTAVRDLCNNGVFGIDAVVALIGGATIAVIFSMLTVRAYMRKA